MLANPMNNNKFSLKSLFTGRRQAKLNQSLHKSPLQIPDDDLNSSKGSVNKLPCGGLTKPSKFKDAPKIPPQKSSSPRYSSNPLLDIKLLEQISQLETELDSMKRRANCEQINNGILSDELLKIKRICKDMMATNEILCKANKKNQEKWEQMSYAMEFYKAFYHKYMDLISKRKPQTRGAIMEIPNIEALKKINETLVTGLELTPVKLFTERDREESDLSNKPECSKTPRRSTKIVQTPYQFTKQQAKAFLINLSKEFYANIHPALAALENSPTIPEEREDNEVKCRTKVRRSRRSMSNALDYVCARRKLIFEPIQEEEPEEIRRAQRKGSLVAWNNAQGRGNEIGILALQANRLASIKNSEHLSFSIDMEELDKVKATETSFISTNDFIQTLD